MLSPERSYRLCALAALLWVLVVPVGRYMSNPVPYDFTQYYMGGVIALEGEWDALYPHPNIESEYNAGYPVGSTPTETYRRLAREHGVPDSYRFTQTPTIALLYAPLGAMPFEAAYFTWVMLLGLACWLSALCAGEIARQLRPERARRALDGVLVLGICLSPLTYATIRTANVSAYTGLGVGTVLLAMRARRDVLVVGALTATALLKYATGILGAMLIVCGRFRAAATTMAVGAAIVGITVLWTGIEPWNHWIRDVIPTMAKVPYERSNQSVAAAISLWHRGHRPPAEAFVAVRVAGFVLLASIVSILWLQRKRVRESFDAQCASAALLLAWWAIASPLFWTHYFFYFVPLWGWLWSEAGKGRWRCAAAVTAVGLTFCPWLVTLELPFPWGTYMLLSIPVLIALAVARLWEPRERPDTDDAALNAQVAA